MSGALFLAWAELRSPRKNVSDTTFWESLRLWDKHCLDVLCTHQSKRLVVCGIHGAWIGDDGISPPEAAPLDASFIHSFIH
jgi:hypothetical protein